MSQPTVIIGAGQAGYQAAASLRKLGHAGPITLLGDEPHAPYQRPPLSKAYLAGDFDRARLYFQDAEFWAANHIDLRLGVRAVRLDRAAARVELDDGAALDYGHVILAAGTRPRRLEAPGADLPGVHVLRGIDDVDAIRAGFAAARNVVVVGAGYIGLEVAAVARTAGKTVTVIEDKETVLNRVAGPEISAFYEHQHRAAGVAFHLADRVRSFAAENGRVARVDLESGAAAACDLAIVGVGVVANAELAAEAGLKTEDGIWVDAHARTEDPRVLAAGDVANHPSALYGRRVRLESVHNAIEQAKTAAAAVAGVDTVYDQVPWFWSDQYDLKLQTAGLSEGHDEIAVRGAPQDRSFCVFYLRNGRVIASDAVNRPAEHMLSRKLIAARAEIGPARLADENLTVKDLLAAA